VDIYDLMLVCWMLVPLVQPLPEYPYDTSPNPYTASPEEWAALKRFAITQDLVGEGEAWSVSYSSERAWVRRQWWALIGAPPSHDAQHLPDYATARDNVQFNHQYQLWLEACICRTETQRKRREDALLEAQVLGVLWGHIQSCQSVQMLPAIQRHSLAKIRELMGYQAYGCRDWPCPVPLHYYRID
jgi:hypothetical protein